MLEKPYVMLFAGDFNAHSKSWYADGDTNSEGIQLNTLFSDLGLSQLISEPTHTRENCNPMCIDLILTDQPNLIMETGARPSLDPIKSPFVNSTLKYPLCNLLKGIHGNSIKLNVYSLRDLCLSFNGNLYSHRTPILIHKLIS